MNTPREQVLRYWQAANARDWQAFAELLAEHIVYEVPQTRERVRGRSNYLEFNRTWPGLWRAEIQQLVADDYQAISVIAFHVDGATETGISVFEFDAGGRIAHITDHWPAPYEPPERACACIERY